LLTPSPSHRRAAREEEQQHPRLLSVRDQPPLPALRARLAWGNKLCAHQHAIRAPAVPILVPSLASFPSRDPFIGTRFRLPLQAAVFSISLCFAFPVAGALQLICSFLRTSHSQPTPATPHNRPLLRHRLRDQPYDRPLRLRQPHGLPWHSQYPSSIESVPPESVPESSPGRVPVPVTEHRPLILNLRRCWHPDLDQ
jgi:hypothetical protein